MAFENDELNKRREARRKEQEFMAQQYRWLKIGAIVTAAVMVLCGAAILITKGLVNLPRPTPPTVEVPPTTEPKPVIPDTVIHFLAGGDVNVTDKVVSSGQNPGGYDYTPVFLDVAGLLSGSDVTSVNFEGNLYGDSYGSASACAPVQLMQALGNAGVDLVQTANSYANHNGLRGLTATLDGIRSQGMTPVGTFANDVEFEKTRGFTVLEINGIRIAVVAFTKGMNGTGLPKDSENCVNLLYTDYSSTYQTVDKEGISSVLNDIALEKCDVTIALLHWGSEYSDAVSKTQDEIRELMLSNGVDAIIGTHPHYVQKVEYTDGKVVAYSLGDLLGDGDKPGTNYSILLDLEIRKNGETGEVSISAVDHVPVFLADEREIGGSLRLLRIREAMAAYENNFVDKVSKETYEAMASALERIEARVKGE
ncbi:MAG: CapA family protein [Ruminococcaceae bacterium]|nr:CapA family protein [Oscillospiraceae bacterium]